MNKRKYEKQKRPDFNLRKKNEEENAACDDSSDDDLPEISFDQTPQCAAAPAPVNSCQKKGGTMSPIVTETVTEKVTDAAQTNASPAESQKWIPVAEEITENDFVDLTSSGSSQGSLNEVELLEVCRESCDELRLVSENVFMTDIPSGGINKVDLLTEDESIPDEIYWHSILTAFENCHDFQELTNLVKHLHGKGLRPLAARNTGVYVTGVDKLDFVAQGEIPPDGPTSLKAVFTIGDGNCFCHSSGKAYFNDDSKHIELHVRIIIGAIIHMDEYLSDSCLECGASYIHENADLPLVFATFSEYYTPGQKLTSETIHYIYYMEVYSCSHLGSYMGLWQIAQAASVLDTPIHTIYPIRGESTLCNDFHRIFFPVQYLTTKLDDNPIVIILISFFICILICTFITLILYLYFRLLHALKNNRSLCQNPVTEM